MLTLETIFHIFCDTNSNQSIYHFYKIHICALFKNIFGLIHQTTLTINEDRGKFLNSKLVDHDRSDAELTLKSNTTLVVIYTSWLGSIKEVVHYGWWESVSETLLTIQA